MGTAQGVLHLAYKHLSHRLCHCSRTKNVLDAGFICTSVFHISTTEIDAYAPRLWKSVLVVTEYDLGNEGTKNSTIVRPEIFSEVPW